MSQNQKTLLTAKELAPRIKFNSGYINNTLKDTIFFEGIHYIRPFGGRKVFYLWEAVEAELYRSLTPENIAIPMARGGIAHG